CARGVYDGYYVPFAYW
nr:immunoglobulin heavy chain junction region [Mus musculus]